MSHTSLILTALMTLALTVFIAPGVFALNRGHILRNVALWLGIFLGLGLIYQNFGPDSPHPMFQLPSGMSGMRVIPAEHAPTEKSASKDKNEDATGTGEEGFTPPKE